MVVADFFLKVHGLRWVAVCGVSGGRLIAIFRGGFGAMDLGAVASRLFAGMGGGGGHKNMARAEMALTDIPAEFRGGLEEFLFRRLVEAEKKRSSSSAAVQEDGAAKGRER